MSLEALFAIPLIASKPERFSGTLRPIGEVALAGHAMLLAATAFGPSELTNLPPDPALVEVADMLGALGAGVEWSDAERSGLMVWGTGVGALTLPPAPLGCNDTSRAAALMGLVAPYDMTVRISVPAALEPELTGIAAALGQSGTNLAILRGERAVFALTGPRQPLPPRADGPLTDLPTLEALIMAGLYPPGRTRLHLADGLRTDLAFLAMGFGANLELRPHSDGGQELTLAGQARLAGCDGAIPGSIETVLLPLLTALIVPGAELRIEAVARNARLGGLMSLLGAMQANIAQTNPRTLFGVPVVDLIVSHSALTGSVATAADMAAAGLDPALLAVLAAAAEGRSRIALDPLKPAAPEGDDPVPALLLGLGAIGIAVTREADEMLVEGTGAIAGNVTVETLGDPRLARAFLLAGQVATAPLAIDDRTALGPGHQAALAEWVALGANVVEGEHRYE